MIVNHCFHVFGATIADLDAASVEDLVEAVVSRKMLYQVGFQRNNYIVNLR